MTLRFAKEVWLKARQIFLNLNTRYSGIPDEPERYWFQVSTYFLFQTYR